MGKYDGKVALITGGTSGIGLATAKISRDEGMRVAVTGRDPKGLEVARRELGETALVLASDSAKLADIDALAEKVKSHFGGLDLLFVNAGLASFAPLEAVTEAFWDDTFAVNTKGAYFTVQKLAPLLREGGAVVFNTSVADQKGFASASVYSASKAALRSLSRTLSTELLPRGIRVNAVSPGPISTPLIQKAGLPADAIAGYQAQQAESNPMKRLGSPDEVARAVLFLAFDATFTTGAELAVDGGLTQL